MQFTFRIKLVFNTNTCDSFLQVTRGAHCHFQSGLKNPAYYGSQLNKDVEGSPTLFWTLLHLGNLLTLLSLLPALLLSSHQSHVLQLLFNN